MVGRYFKTVLIFIWVAVVFLPGKTFPQSCLDYRDYVHPTASMFMGEGSLTGMVGGGCFWGQYLLAASGWSGVRIIDVSDPSFPWIVSTATFPGFCKDVAVKGSTAYVVTEAHGMHIVDISNPATPILLETLYDHLNFESIEVAGDRAFFVDYYGLNIMDISNPVDPISQTGYMEAGIGEVLVEGNLLYMTSYGSLVILEISDPLYPLELSETVTVDSSHGLAKSGSYVYVAVDFSGLEVLDVSDPTNPFEVAVNGLPQSASDVEVVSDIAYVAVPYGGIFAFDITSPASPTYLWSLDFHGDAEAVFAKENILCLADGYQGIQLMDIDGPAASVLARKTTSDPLTGVACQGQYCYVAEGGLGMQVFDVSNPFTPLSVTLYTPGNPVSDVLVAGDLAFLAGSSVQIVDISDPAAPSPLGWYNRGNSGSDLFLDGDLLFVTDSHEWWIADVSDPTAPTHVGVDSTPGESTGIFVRGNLAYVTGWGSGFFIYDISDPTNPVIIGSTVADGYYVDVDVSGDLAYLVGPYGLGIVDIFDPTAPVLIQNVRMPGKPSKVKIDGAMAYVICPYSGVHLVDISDTAMAHLVGWIPTEDESSGVAISENHVFIADGDGGLAVALKMCPECSPVLDPVSLPVVHQLEGVFPNPFNPRTTIMFTLAEPGRVNLEVFDLAGRLVRLLESGYLDGRSHRMTWDGRDNGGRAVASAPYIVRLQAGGMEEYEKILLLR